MLVLFVLLVAVAAVLLFAVGLSLQLMFVLAAVAVMLWSAGAFVSAGRERRDARPAPSDERSA
jgi:hypothetical protein